MAEDRDRSAEEQEVAQPEADSNNPFEDPRVKERMGAIAAQKNQAKEQLTQAQQELEAYRQRLAALEAQAQAPAATPGDDDPDAAWVDRYITPKLQQIQQNMTQQVMQSILPMKDQNDKAQFWTGRTEAPEVVEMVEDMVAQYRAQGIEVDRQNTLWLVKGKLSELQVAAETQQAQQVNQVVQQVNQAAQVATGGPTQPEPEISFDELSTEDQYKQLLADGDFNSLYQEHDEGRTEGGYLDLRDWKKKK